ncbi:MAG: hypothetical protein GPJ51_02400, partial [Candidatus Heimdallarchaeota archaeon]|nr:hypothetical protein [Candidatus Heimdallarchaeota archaeon]
ITIDVDGLSAGVYNYTIWISDQSGQTNVDTVIVTVETLVIPELNTEILFLAVPISIGVVILFKRKQRIFK